MNAELQYQTLVVIAGLGQLISSSVYTKIHLVLIQITDTNSLKRSFMKVYVLAVSFLLFSSCATVGKYQARLQPWVGKNEGELVSIWGIPSSTYPLNNGSKMIMYERHAGATTTPIGGVYYTENYYCKTTFTIDEEGIIKNYQLEGNNCVSY